MKNIRILVVFISIIIQSVRAQETLSLSIPSSQTKEKLIQEANQLYVEEKYQKVIDLLSKIKQKREAHYFLEGKSYSQLEKHSEAIESFEKCIELDAKNAEYYYWLGLNNINALQGDDNFFKKGVYAFDAQDALETAISLKPTHTLARIRLAHYYLNAPLIAGGSISKAKEQATELLKYDKKQGNILLASIYRHNEEYDKAEALYLQLIENNENTEKVYYYLAEISLEKKDYSKSFQYLEKSLKLYPQYPMPHYQYGKLSALSNKNLSEGIKHLKIFIELDQPSNLPADHWAFYRLGQIYVIQGKNKEAKNAFQEALNIKPDFEQAKEELKQL